MLRIVAPIAALGLIASPALAATMYKTTHKTHRMAKKPMAKKSAATTTASTTTTK